jgi:ATP-dependent Clp protease protease subunit
MRKVYITGEISSWWNNAKMLRWAFEEENEIELYFNSPGGDPVESGAMYEEIKSFKGKITAYGVGDLSSAAILPFLAVPKERRFVAKTAVMVMHNPSAYAYGDHAELQKAADSLREMREVYGQIYAEELGLSAKETLAIMENDKLEMAPRMIELGIASGYISDKKEEEEKTAFSMMRRQSGTLQMHHKDSKMDAHKKTITHKEEDMTEKEKNALRQEGAKMERERLEAIDRIAMSQHADLVEAAKADFTMTAEMLAVKQCEAELQLAMLAGQKTQNDIAEEPTVSDAAPKMVPDSNGPKEGTKEYYMQRWNDSPQIQKYNTCGAEVYAEFQMTRKGA